MDKKSLIITGATGFIGGYLVRALQQKYRLYCIGRLTPAEAGAPEGPDIHWFQVDVGQFEALRQVFCDIRRRGGASFLIHLAAHYDFTGEDHPEYVRSNVVGTLNVIELSASMLKLRKFFFTSSVAACPFPPPGGAITEDTPPTAPFPYARSKWLGEEIMKAYRDRVPSCILRLAAVFSDWCEYAPLCEFLKTWCSHRWNARVIGGKGRSALPFLHVNDLTTFYTLLLKKHERLGPAETILASPNGSTTHLDLFREATHHCFGAPRTPVHVPKAVARPGVVLRTKLGSLVGRKPFERPWMVDLVDLRLDVDATRTYRRLNWAPSPDLDVIKRISFMIENMRNHPREWKRRNEWREKRREMVLSASTTQRLLLNQNIAGGLPFGPLI